MKQPRPTFLHELINTGAITVPGSRKPVLITGSLLILAAFAYAFIAGGLV